jgi:hypothetical protein
MGARFGVESEWEKSCWNYGDKGYKRRLCNYRQEQRV